MSPMRFFVISLLAVFVLFPTSGQAADPIEGLWYSRNHEGGVELYACETSICGRIHWLGDQDNGALDSHNPEPSLRNRPLCSLQLLTGFQPDNQGNYFNGDVYDPQSGSTYKAQMKLLAPDRLEIHGYILLPLLGASQIWTKASPAVMPDCAAKP